MQSGETGPPPSLCEDVTVRVGRSASGSKTVGADVTECPHRVDKSNWHGGHTHQDRFEIYVWRTGAVTARRIDACGGCAWGMDLEFLCRRCPERPPLWTRAQRVFATMQSLAWEQCSDEGACLVTVHDV